MMDDAGRHAVHLDGFGIPTAHTLRHPAGIQRQHIGKRVLYLQISNRNKAKLNATAPIPSESNVEELTTPHFLRK